MRIEKVLIHNINSLAGTFEIDFTKGDYTQGLFAIVGPSGAGKSTVFDAICLALYGKTPRINAISETHNEIMTKSESECHAEVVFWSRGKRYKAAFSHARAKGQNPFRQVKREIIEYGQDGVGKPIATMIKEAAIKIVEITGLDYNQFTRSIMLAQFAFDEFLKADSSKRAEILEKISDMDIYRDISAAVYQRTKSEEAKLLEIRTKMQVVKVLDDTQQKGLENEFSKLDDLISTHNSIKDIFEICSLNIVEIEKNSVSLAGYEKDKPLLEEKLNTQNKLLLRSNEDEQKQKAEQSKLYDTLKTVRALDNKIAIEKANIKRVKNEIKQDEDKVKENKTIILNLFKKYMPDADNAKLKNLYDMDDSAESIRAEAKADLQKADDKEKSLRKQMGAVLHDKDESYWRGTIELLEIVLPIAQSNRAIAQSELRQIGLNEKQKKLEETEKEQQTKGTEIQEKYLLVRLEEKFGQERRRLEDGKPCPLCGAVKHPGADTLYNESFLQKVTEQKNLLLKEAEKTKRDIIENKSSLAAEEKLTKEKQSVIEKSKKMLSVLGKKPENAKIDLIDDAASENIEERIDAAKDIIRQHSALLKELGSVSNDVIKYTKQLGDVDKDVLVIDNNKQTIKDIEQSNEKRQSAKDKAQKELDKYLEKRIEIFGQKDADEEETKAKDAVKKAGEEIETCREKYQTAKSEFEKNSNNISQIQKAIEEKSSKLENAYLDGKKRLKEVCDAPSINDDNINVLLEEIRVAVKSLKDSAKQSSAEISEMADKLKELWAKETERKGRVSEQLEANEQRKKELADMLLKEKQFKKTYEKWSRLNALIGSAAGDKFSRMAQGITFEVLLQYANQSLKKMSDQFILVRDATNISKPLEISVIDKYNAGDIRPVSNLSGGESFIVSMALALGLSEMSSNKTRIDSLFIDEGFASLDEDYLEAALQTLSSIGNRENKLVGVISHVNALKERIDTKIQVDKLSGGRSTLSGPGVTAVNER